MLDTKTPRRDAILSFVEYIERKLGLVALYPLKRVSGENASLIEPFRLVTKFQSRGMLGSCLRTDTFPDEPLYRAWVAKSCDNRVPDTIGISSNDRDAVYEALSTLLKAYITITQSDYFVSPQYDKTAHEIESLGFPSIEPGKPPLSRDTDARDKRRTWILGDSLTSGRKTYVPAESVRMSGIPGAGTYQVDECFAGVGIGHTKSGAQLHGLLALIEHDAATSMWENQPPLPCLPAEYISEYIPAIAPLIRDCRRYRLKIHALPMLTDAPTHAMCVVAEDRSGQDPRFTIGVKAHQNMGVAIEKALRNALRSRIIYRTTHQEAKRADRSSATNHGGDSAHQRDRFECEKAAYLEEILGGAHQEPQSAEWENDSDDVHRERILRWCLTKRYECVAVSLGASKANVLPGHIEKVMIHPFCEL